MIRHNFLNLEEIIKGFKVFSYIMKTLLSLFYTYAEHVQHLYSCIDNKIQRKVAFLDR